MKRILTVLFLGLCFSLGYSEKFEFSQQLGQKYRIKNLIRQDIYLNGQFYASKEAMNKALLHITKTDKNSAYIVGQYSYYSKNAPEEPFQFNKVYDTEFYRDRQGMMRIDQKYFMPTLRNIPVFPTNNLRVGDTWEGVGEEMHEPIFQGMGTIVQFPVNVYYKYLDKTTNDGENMGILTIDYHVIHYPSVTQDKELFSVTGFSHVVFFWNFKTGSPDSYYDDFSFLFTLRNGQSVLYKGTSEAQVETVYDVTNKEKQKLVTEISNTVAVVVTAPTNTNAISAAIISNTIDNSQVKVKTTDDGIIVNLGDILFDINKASLKQEAYPILDKVADVLRKYPNLDIIVSGHTDNTGKEDYNQKLSEYRAGTIAAYLIKQGVAKSRISYVGYGSTRPVAANTTAPGRAQNRRAEIKIITKE